MKDEQVVRTNEQLPNADHKAEDQWAELFHRRVILIKKAADQLERKLDTASG